jgi:hypothetical protein
MSHPPLTPNDGSRCHPLDSARKPNNGHGTPSSAEIQTAIAVLQRLRRRMDAEAACAASHYPAAPLADTYLAELEAAELVELQRIDVVLTQLHSWSLELHGRPSSPKPE